MPEPEPEPEPPDASSRPDDGDYRNHRFLELVRALWADLPPEVVAEAAPGDTSWDTPDVKPRAGTSRIPAITIGRFRVRGELGRGGGGVVLLAFDPALRRTVAMKVPGLEALLSARARRRFLDEARAVAMLHHPNIVAIHEAGEAGPVPYLIMDYCEAG